MTLSVLPGEPQRNFRLKKKKTLTGKKSVWANDVLMVHDYRGYGCFSDVLIVLVLAKIQQANPVFDRTETQRRHLTFS